MNYSFKTLCLFASLFPMNSAYAQEVKKNQIATDISWAVVNLLGMSNNETSQTLIYRRHLNNRWRLHASGTHFSHNRNGEPAVSNSIMYSDSTFYNSSTTTLSNHFQFMMGAQYGKFENPFSWLYGTDLVFGAKKTDVVYSDGIMLPTDFFQYIAAPSGSSRQVYADSIASSMHAMSMLMNESKQWYGMNLNIGLRQDLGKRFEFSVMLINALFIEAVDQELIQPRTKEVASKTFSTFNYRFDSIHLFIGYKL